MPVYNDQNDLWKIGCIGRALVVSHLRVVNFAGDSNSRSCHWVAAAAVGTDPFHSFAVVAPDPSRNCSWHCYCSSIGFVDRRCSAVDLPHKRMTVAVDRKPCCYSPADPGCCSCYCTVEYSVAEKTYLDSFVALNSWSQVLAVDRTDTASSVVAAVVVVSNYCNSLSFDSTSVGSIGCYYLGSRQTLASAAQTFGE